MLLNQIKIVKKNSKQNETGLSVSKFDKFSFSYWTKDCNSVQSGNADENCLYQLWYVVLTKTITVNK